MSVEQGLENKVGTAEENIEDHEKDPNEQGKTHSHYV